MKQQPNVPLNLTHAQRKVLADILPALADRLKIAEVGSRTVHFKLKEVREIAAKCQTTLPKTSGMVRNSIRHITEAAAKALELHRDGGIGGIPAAERVYQFKVTLKGIKPPIWRRIQTKDCTLDKLHEQLLNNPVMKTQKPVYRCYKSAYFSGFALCEHLTLTGLLRSYLHEHIQTAMGWTNSHLHQFEIGGVRHGDPELIYEGWEDEEPPVNSLRTKVSKIVPADGKRFAFNYEYDFGDGWQHEILFEGSIRAEKGTRYPLCVEGQRACPPEDVGGPHGYQEYLKTLSDPDNKEWDEMSDWRGPCRPEHFDAQAATKDMGKGLPNWREME